MRKIFEKMNAEISANVVLICEINGKPCENIDLHGCSRCGDLHPCPCKRPEAISRCKALWSESGTTIEKDAQLKMQPLR